MKKIATVFALFLLAGCSTLGWNSDDAPSFVCPQLGLVDAADQIDLVSGSPDTINAEDVIIHGAFGSYRGACRPNEKDGAVDFDIDVDFLASKGPAGASANSGELPYFIAILSPDETILQREAFSTTIAFDANDTAPIKTEKHHISLPLSDLNAAQNYKVVIGFAQTPAQNAFANKPAETPQESQ